MVEFQESVRQDLIKLYTDFIRNPDSPSLKEQALEMDKVLTSGEGVFFDKSFQKPIWNLYRIWSGELSIEEAKALLELLSPKQ